MEFPGGSRFSFFFFFILVTEFCLTLYDPMDDTLPGSSVREISQARIPKWVDISFSRESS